MTEDRPKAAAGIARRPPPALAVIAGVFAAYAVAGWIGLRFAMPPTAVGLVWPASGIAVAAVFLFGAARTLPAIIGASLVLSHADPSGYAATISPGASIVFALAAGLEAVIPAIAARYLFSAARRDGDPVSIGRFLLFAGPMAAFAAAGPGTGVLIAFGVIAPEHAFETALTWWVGDTLGIVTVGLAIVTAGLDRGVQSRPRRYFVAASIIALFAGVSAAYSVIGERYRHAALDRLHRTANDLASAFEQRLGDNVGVLRQMDVFRHVFGAMTPENFRDFTKLHFEALPELSAVSWSRFAGPEDWPQTLQRLRQLYGAGFTPPEPWHATGTAEAQLPGNLIAMMVEPAEDYAQLLGADLSHRAEFVAAIGQSLRTGLPTATQGLPNPAGIFQGTLVMAFLPYYAGPGPKNFQINLVTPPEGFHIALFDVGETVERVFSGFEAEPFHARLIDRTGPGPQTVLFAQVGTPSPERRGGDVRRTAGAPTWTFAINHLGRNWLLDIGVRPAAAPGGIASASPVVAISGILISLLFAYLVLMVSNQSAVLSALIRAKTDELETANRRQAELLFRFTASEARLRAAQRIAKVCTWEWDSVADRFVSVSDDYAGVLGLPTGRSVATLADFLADVHPEDRAPVEKCLRAAMNGENGEHARTPLTAQFRAGGTPATMHRIELVAEAQLDENGVPQRILGTFRDISDQLETAEHLRQSEERLRQATQLAGLGHFVRNRTNDTYQFCSPEYAAIFGFSIDAFLRRASTPADRLALVHPADRDAYARAIRELAKGNVMNLSYRVQTENGMTRYVREMIRPVLDSQGNVVQEIGVGQDVTAFELAEEQLRQSHRMEALGKLTGGVAHDFNNLLFVVKGNAELLAREAGRSNPLIEEIRTAVDRATKLTTQLLAFSRRQPLSPNATAPQGIFTQLSGLLRLTLGEAIDFEVHCPTDAWPVMIDRAQFENAVINIAVNARDAMKGGGRFTIRCSNLDLGAAAARSFEVEEGQYVVISFTDTGSGMPASVRERAFEPFFTTKGVGEGSGLGLSMVYGFARQSGGHAEILSEEGTGTTISLILPRGRFVDPDETELAATMPVGHGETILLVEDDAAVRLVTETMLTDLGYRVISAATAAEAMSAITAISGEVKGIISDVVLPGGMSGPAFVAQVLRRYPDLGVVFMSGYPDEVISSDPDMLRGASRLRKPFEAHELAAAISKAISGVRRSANAETLDTPT